VRHKVSQYFFILLFMISGSAWAQLQVDTQISIEDAIARLVGQGVRVSNVRIDCPSKSGRAYGYFSDNTGTLGLTDGLIISTGAARNSIGPNNSGAASQGNGNERQDQDLKSIIRNNEKQYDACVVEFDVQVFADTLIFDYVFGSEEYLEFIKDYHDVFGFFISGPGISGRINLATIPGTATPLSVQNVNNVTNSTFYIDNGTGATPFDNLFVQYDGFTKRLQTRVAVVPCEVYSLKLAICDIKDDIYDAGVFIGGKSLKTKAPLLSVAYEYNVFPNAVEGCNGAFVTVTRQSRLQEAVKFGLQYGGTATRNLDYGNVPDSISFSAGDTSKTFFVAFGQDGINDDREVLNIQLINPCPELPPVDELEVLIRESFDFDIPNDTICFGDTVRLNPNPTAGYTFAWLPADYLSCSNCPSPVANPAESTTWSVTATHIQSGCQANDSVRIALVPPPVAAFSFETLPDFTNLDLFFTNLSANANQFFWSFGDGATSNQANPRHYYQSGYGQDSVSYPIVLTAINNKVGCADSSTAIVRIGNPFFIPNLVTANADEINDMFFIKGIRPGIWSLEIFDRWGKSVYQSNAYNLDWRADQTVGGTYFFKLTNPGGPHVFTGWVVVIK